MNNESMQKYYELAAAKLLFRSRVDRHVLSTCNQKNFSMLMSIESAYQKTINLHIRMRHVHVKLGTWPTTVDTDINNKFNRYLE